MSENVTELNGRIAPDTVIVSQTRRPQLDACLLEWHYPCKSEATVDMLADFSVNIMMPCCCTWWRDWRRLPGARKLPMRAWDFSASGSVDNCRLACSFPSTWSLTRIVWQVVWLHCMTGSVTRHLNARMSEIIYFFFLLGWWNLNLITVLLSGWRKSN